ncbi:MAG: diphosphomevalonate decarboxylase [Bacteroidetes bacterium]|nr:diphosphomevalonate decarboxylase [Bacteroidota bacterium]
MQNIRWKSPSNIALIKYWGKHGVQLPSNPSLSFTLSESYTTTTLSYTAGKAEVELLFNDVRNEKFALRVKRYIASLYPHFPFLKELDLHINSENNFPHSAGIASSASAMSSLALCLCSLEKEIVGINLSKADFLEKASYIARLGSGSASRSVYGGYVSWGESQYIPESSDEWATPLSFEVHENFRELQDAILIVDESPKAIGSSEGHRLMEKHPYAQQRFEQAHIQVATLLKALKNGDKHTFIRIVENEALSLHGLMMSSDPGYILIKPGTLQIIDKIRNFRENSGIPVSFTLDAGPNVHLLYPAPDKEAVQDFINRELLVYCMQKRRIDDHIGKGPEKLSGGE